LRARRLTDARPRPGYSDETIQKMRPFRDRLPFVRNDGAI